jgi:peptide/nickel transport system substrate-binding protein
MLFTICLLVSCGHYKPSNMLVMIIESSPANLDPRIGTDAQSERISNLIFDSLVRRDEHFELQPGLAEKWENPDSLTWVFHIRHGVRFHDGRPLNSRDVKFTFDSLMNGTIISARASTYQFVQSIEAPDDYTIIFHMKEPFATLLWNVSNGAMGIVPYGSGKEFAQHPIGSGPFKFVSASTDEEVVIARNDDYWDAKPKVERIRFAVILDPTTRALELRKGSADLASNTMSADMVEALRQEPTLEVQTSPGTIFSYIALNVQDPTLKDKRVRQALAYATDRTELIRYLWRGEARPAASILPTQHWAFASDVPQYPYDPARAAKLLDEAGFPAMGPDGIRFHLSFKTSTEETARLQAVVFQQQWRKVGIAVDIHTYEFATFYSDVVKGLFQAYSLRWIGGNEDPDIFEHCFHSASFPPKRANRSRYTNPKLDELIDRGRRTINQQDRKPIYAEIQKILAEDQPYINLWYLDNVIVHSHRVKNIHPMPSGNYDFLREVEMVP